MDPPDVTLRNLDYTSNVGFYVSKISRDTDENLNDATFTVSLSSAPSADNVTITMSSSDTTEGVISSFTGQGSDNTSQLVFTSSAGSYIQPAMVTKMTD